MNLIGGIVRRFFGGGRQTTGTPAQLGGDFTGALGLSQVLPPRALGAAAGRRFGAVNGNGSTFLAPVTAVPTTTLTMALWNGESDGGKSYFIESVFAFLASGTPDVGGALLACVTLDKQAANPTAYAGTVISGLSGKQGGASKARFVNNITAVGGTPAWQLLDRQPAIPATAKIAAGAFLADVQGSIVLPPGYMLGLTVLAGAGTTPLFGFGASWLEVEADLE